MESNLFAQGILILFAAVAVLIVLRQALTWPSGWRAWLLSVTNRLYLRGCFHLRTSGARPFPSEGPAIIIANHSSPLDPMFVWLGDRRVIGFLMAQEYYDVPIVHWISETMQSIPVQRDGKDLAPSRAALRRLKGGDLLGVFPEGRLNCERDLLPGNPGVAWLALRSQAPVYPVYIHNSPGGTNMVEPFYNFCRVRMTYGEKIDLSDYYDKKLTQELLHDVTDLLMSHLAELGGVRWTSCVGHTNSDPDNTAVSSTVTAQQD